MTTFHSSDRLHALRRANPRARAGFAEAVEAVGVALHAQLDAAGGRGARTESPAARLRLVRAGTAGASLAAVAAVAAFLTIGSPGDGPGVQSATAAVAQAAGVTAAAAEHSGTVVVRMTHEGEPWARTKRVRWNGEDVAIADDPTPMRPEAGGLRVVDGTLYGTEPDRGWVILGSPASIDPDSGTTPAEYLAAVREDVGGVTLRRLVAGTSGLTAGRLDNGATLYRGTVPAGLIARETGFKEGHAIRVLPFGYVAHGEAADPAAQLDLAVTVGADGVVRELAVTWGKGGSAWTYTVAYSELGTTPAPVAPANAQPLRRHIPAEPARG